MSHLDGKCTRIPVSNTMGQAQNESNIHMMNKKYNLD